MVSKIHKCIKLEVLCLLIAFINMIFRLIFLALALVGQTETLYLLTLPDPPEVYGPAFRAALRPLLMTDCLISLVFTVMLIVGVKKSNHRLLRICYLYGITVLCLSVIGTIPSIIKKIAYGDMTNMGRRLLALLGIAICAAELLVVFKTYRKFYNTANSERMRLVDIAHGAATIVLYRNSHLKAEV